MAEDADRALPPMGGARLLLAALLTARRSGRGPFETAARRFVGAPIGRDRVRAFALALGYPGSEAVPLGVVYLLAQRAQVAVMLDPQFPLPLPGLVHVANDMRLHSPVDPSAPLRLSCTARKDGAEGSGATTLAFDVVVEQHGADVATCRSTYLARGRTRGSRRAPRPDAPAPLHAPLEAYALDAGAGRRYARLSGDVNPIHLWSWSARLFGFRRPIIHGMHTAGRVEAALARASGHRVLRLAARFRRPIALPAEVTVHARDGAFQARVGAEVCVDGDYELQR